MFSTLARDKNKAPVEAKAQRANSSPAGKAGPDQNPLWQSLALRHTAVQAKLAISQPDDPYEQEADRVADRVMRMAAPKSGDAQTDLRRSGNSKPSNLHPGSRKVQRKCGSCEEEDERALRRKEETGRGKIESTVPPSVHDALNSPGRQLDPATQSFMEIRFGRDFSQVQVHTDSRAAESARAINALAYTVGRDVVFNHGRYRPESADGKRLIAHELAHVSQGERAGAPMIQRQTDQTEEGRRTVRHDMGQYIRELRFTKVINDCPTASGVRLLDALMRVRGRVEGNTRCREFFQRRLGTDLLPMLSPFRPPTFTVDPSLTGSGHTGCAPRPVPGHPSQPANVRLGENLCTSPHLDRVIVHELAHQTGCRPGGVAAAWDEAVVNEAADICVGTVQDQLDLHNRAAAADPRTSPEDWNFTALDLAALQQRGTGLRFDSDSSWFPAPLRQNLRNTLIYLLAPLTAEPRTEGVNPTDLFHGHVVVPHGEDPASLISQRDAWTTDIVDTRQRVLGAGLRVTDANRGAYRQETRRLEGTAGPLLESALRAPGAAVIYHTFEFPAPGSPQSQIRRGAPRRNCLTRVSTNVPAPYTAPDLDDASSYQRDYTHIFQFAFLVDRTGVIHVRPNFVEELSDVVGRPLNH
jgi:hypothetical protein